MQRRPLLAALAASVSAAAWPLPKAPAQLLVVFLRGGYDALSLLVPRSGFYAEARPHLAIEGALPVDADWQLHPALEPSLWPLLQAGQLAFVPYAGTHDASRSHFETQDRIEGGLPLDARRDLSSGFLNRLAQQLGGGDPIAFTDQLPLALRGPLKAVNVSLRRLDARADKDRLQAAIASMYRGHPLQDRVDDAFALRDRVALQMAEEKAEEQAMAAQKADGMLPADRSAVAPSGFALEARRMARLMRDGHAIGFIDVGGWDTHVGQGGSVGPLATRLGDLGRGLQVFAEGLGAAGWRRTVVVVISEFGRTVRENGARGTDHGHGTVYGVLGGGLTGRPVAGEQVPLRADTLFEQRDLPVLNEQRAVLGGLFARQFGLGADALDAVFPGATPRDLGLL